jgi:ParB family chromosome partitioning protein
MEKRHALGKGLGALIPVAPQPELSPTELEIDRLSPNRFQPRGEIDDARLDELAQSIRSNGVIQPIVVRKTGGEFQIIAGERRWRAARKAGLTRVPVVVKEIGPGQERSLLEMALIENIQRENLNAIDEALAYRRLSEEFHHTQEQIATAVGKDRATVANLVRLLKLPEEVRARVASGALSTGHARAILALSAPADQVRLAEDVVTRGLSVRETEALARRRADAPRQVAGTLVSSQADVHTRAAEERLRLALGTRVRIQRKGAGGRIEIDFVSESELIRIFEQLTETRGTPAESALSSS